MFGTLFLKECKQLLKSTTYYVLVICMVLFYTTQLGELNMIEKPRPGQQDYGMDQSDDENVIMNMTLETMIREYRGNNYVTYPIGFYKEVTLSKKKQDQIADILAQLTGRTTEDLNAALKQISPTVTTEQLGLTIDQNMTYEQFHDLMKKADKLIGGGSNYSDSFLKSNAYVPMTYEDALQDYNDIIQKDRLSGAYARLFCDYLGIVLTILPVFLSVTRGLRDRRARASQIIYSRKASSLSIILSRYLSMVLMVLLPILIMGLGLTVQCVYNGISENISIDYFAFAKYISGWLLPAVLISTAVGVFFTELTESAIGILAMGAWWFLSLFLGIANLKGGYGWNLMPRHNILGGYEVYQEHFNQLVANRITYSILAALLVAAAVFVYDKKRKGKLLIHGKIRSNRESKSKI